MRIEVLAIGDELLDGRVADTNTLRLAERLQEVGLIIAQRTTVRDTPEDIMREARAVVARGTAICVVSGGLGPTADDLTSETFARLADVPLVRDEEQVQRITARLKKRGRDITENQLKQADRPRGAEVIVNDNGTAPGFALSIGGCRFVSVPGVPAEFDAMVERAVLAPLRAEHKPLLRRIVKTFGLIEAEVDKRLAQLAQMTPEVRVGFRVKFPEIHVSLTTTPEHRVAFEHALVHVRTRLGEYVFGEDDADFFAVLLAELRRRGERLATAESCTGGLIADLITNVPGASDVFVGGVTSYAYVTKTDLLGVDNETLTRYGAVSEQTVLEMARGARERFGSTWAVSASGIAGPDGGTPDKPVGTVFIAVAGPNGAAARRLSLPFDRRGNKVVSAYSALDLLKRTLSQ